MKYNYRSIVNLFVNSVIIIRKSNYQRKNGI